MTLERRPKRRPDVDAVDIDGELVLWDPVGRSVHRLDPVGSLLWPFFDGQAAVDELAADAAEVWQITVPEAAAAIVALVQQLEEARLLGEGQEPPSRPAHLVDPPSP